MTAQAPWCYGLFDNVQLAYVDVALPGARGALSDKHRIASIDLELGAIGELQG
jgi:hypothetical protein